MNKTASLIGLGVGAGLMYVLDPDRGRRRRSRLGEKATRAFSRSGGAVSKAMKGVGERAGRMKGMNVPRMRDVSSQMSDVLERNGAPTPLVRCLLGGAGFALAYYGATHRGVLSRTLAALGASMVVQGITNKNVAGLLPSGAGD